MIADESRLTLMLTKSEFAEHYDIETRYKNFHDEYGDLSAP